MIERQDPIVFVKSCHNVSLVPFLATAMRIVYFRSLTVGDTDIATVGRCPVTVAVYMRTFSRSSRSFVANGP